MRPTAEFLLPSWAQWEGDILISRKLSTTYRGETYRWSNIVYSGMDMIYIQGPKWYPTESSINKTVFTHLVNRWSNSIRFIQLSTQGYFSYIISTKERRLSLTYIHPSGGDKPGKVAFFCWWKYRFQRRGSNIGFSAWSTLWSMYPPSRLPHCIHISYPIPDEHLKSPLGISVFDSINWDLQPDQLWFD